MSSICPSCSGNAGLINATLDEHYGTDAVFEFQYKPGGISSGLCLGIAPKINKKGVIAKAQMWQLISGVLP